MKQFLWTNKVMLLILLFDQAVSSRTSNWPKYKQIWQELLQIEYCVQHHSMTLSSTFVLVSLAFLWFFNYAFIREYIFMGHYNFHDAWNTC